jgi:hypothetical protein
VATVFVRRAVAVGGAAAVLLAGCGGGSGAAPARTPGASAAPAAATSPEATADGLPAEELTRQAVTRVGTASSVRIHATMPDDGGTVVIDATEVAGTGCESKVVSAAGVVRIRIVGTTTWLLPNRAWWGSHGLQDPAQLSALDGAWVKLSSGSQFHALDDFCSFGRLMDPWLKAPAPMEKGSTTTVNGRPAVEIKDTIDGTSLFVATQGTPELLKLIRTSDRSRYDFSNYGAAVTLKPPSTRTVDGKRYGM